MPPPIWLRDPTFYEKRGSKTAQNKNIHAYSNKKTAEGDQMVSDLLGELQSIMCENAKLHSTNKTLKSTVNELETKYNGLMQSLELSRSTFETDLNRLHDEIKNNETQLIVNSKMCLQQQKKHVQEIKKVKAENERLHLDIAKNETEFMEKIKNLESEVKLLQLSYNNMKSLNDENAQRSNKYKNKLKYAITIINDLNNMLVHCSKKADYSHQETQTDDGHSKPTQSLHNIQSCPLPQHQHNLETENLLLSDVFFKSREFCDNEIFLLNEKEYDQSFEDISGMKIDL